MTKNMKFQLTRNIGYNNLRIKSTSFYPELVSAEKETQTLLIWREIKSPGSTYRTTPVHHITLTLDHELHRNTL